MRNFAAVTSVAVCFGVVSSVCNAQPQTFYVDFDTIADAEPGTPGLPDPSLIYEYSPEQREFILGYLNEQFAPYGMDFVPGTKPAPGFGSNITLNAGLGAGAEQIDFRNLDDGDDASVNILSLFVIFLGVTEFTDDDVMIGTANAAGHEALHLLGMRHHDKCSPLASGIGGGLFPSDFDPAYPGPVGASQAPATFCALHAGGALGFTNLTTPKVVSERVIPRLQAALDPGFTVAEAGLNNTLPTAQIVELFPFGLPYPIRPALVGDGLDGRALVITGTLDTPGFGGMGFASDYYEFSGEAGEVVTIEAMSYILPDDDGDGTRYSDNADVALVLLAGFGAPPPFGPGAVIPYYTSTAITDDDDDSDDVPSSAPFDAYRSATLLDVILPYTGPYVIEVLPAAPFIGTGKTGMDGGSYELFIYSASPSLAGRCSPADVVPDGMINEDDVVGFETFFDLGRFYADVPAAGAPFADFDASALLDYVDYIEFLAIAQLGCE